MTASPRTSAKELARKFWGDRDDEDAELNLLPPASPGPPPRRPKPW